MSPQAKIYSLTKEERLRGKRNIDSLFSSDRSGFVYPLRYVWAVADSPQDIPASALFSVPKKNHRRANVRNILKRRMREAYRLSKHPLAEALACGRYEGKTIHLGLVYVSKQAEEFKTIQNAIHRIISEIAGGL